MYYRNEQINQQELPKFQKDTYTQCPWADNCPYFQANIDTILRQYHPYQRPPFHRPRLHYHMAYHPYYPPFYNPYYPPYYQHPYEHHYQPHQGNEQRHEAGRDEE